MAPETFGVIAVVGFGCGAVLAVATAAYGATHRVREVRDELTGRAAQRAIDALREGYGTTPAPVRHGARADVQSGSLTLREVASGGRAPRMAVPSRPLAGASASPRGPQGETAASEAGTMLLGEATPAASDRGSATSESATSLLAATTPKRGSAVSEAATSLLGHDAADAATTILSGKGE